MRLNLILIKQRHETRRFPTTASVNSARKVSDKHVPSGFVWQQRYSYVSGDHSTNADLNYFLIYVPPGKGFRAEVIEGNRNEETCESGGIDSRLTLDNTNGSTELADDDDDGRRFCSLIDGTGSAPRNPTARNNTASWKYYYLVVRASTWAQDPTDPNGQFKYRLTVTIR